MPLANRPTASTSTQGAFKRQDGQLLSVHADRALFSSLYSPCMALADDEIEIEDMTWDEVKQVYHYPCPCGDRFEITRVSLDTIPLIQPIHMCSLC